MNNQIAIVGRTNVGKSLLFNKLTKQEKALLLIYMALQKTSIADT